MVAVIDRHGVPAGSIAVALIEDHEDARTALAQILDAHAGFRCVGAFGCVEEALPRLPRVRPAVLLVDLGLPGLSGADGIAILTDRHPDLICLALTVYEDEDRIFEALSAGAAGYLLKNAAPGRLLEAIREAVEGGAPMTPAVARCVVRFFRGRRPPRDEETLTPHELRVLRLLVEGRTYHATAQALGVSVNTIGFHVRHIYDKLQVHSKAEAAFKAFRNRLIR